MKIGFIGLGNVGGKLSGSLIRNGMDVHIHDLDQDLVQNFVAMGGTDGGFTGSGVEFPDGSCMINGTPVVVDTDASSVGSLKARF